MTATINGDQNGTVGLINTMTAKATTSGTAIDFTGIPAGVKRITVMFNGVSTSGASSLLVRIGSGSVVSTGYTSIGSIVSVTSDTTGFVMFSNSSTDLFYGSMVLELIQGNTWVESYTVGMFQSGTPYIGSGGGASPNLSGTLDRVRLTTVNGTDTFDAGSVNILYE